MSNQKVWNDLYEGGHEQRAPWDTVVSFIYRNKPQKPNKEIKILEVGCGTASNLRFFAHQGFHVFGIDFSAEAIHKAKEYLKENKLLGDLPKGRFESLQFDDQTFDFVIDRAALTCVGHPTQQQAIHEIYRVLRSGGHFLFTPYADTHSSCKAGKLSDEGLTYDISAGTLQGVGHIRFLSKEDILSLFPEQNWSIISMEYETRQDILSDDHNSILSSWRVVVHKK